MDKSVINLILVVFVSVFGLLSCAKEKSQSPVADTFTLGVPRIQTVGVTLYASNKVVSGAILPADARIEFPGIVNASEKIRITTETYCRGTQKVHEGNAEFNGKASIRVYDLLPITALSPSADNDTLQCIVNVVGENSHGSRHTLTIPVLNVKMTEREELGLQVRGRQLDLESNVPIVSEEESYELRAYNRNNLKAYEKAYLLCEGQFFSASAVAFSNYGLGSLMAGGGKAYQGKPLVNFQAKPRQKCRIVSEIVSPNRTLESSRVFEIQFPVTVPAIKVRKFFPQIFRPRQSYLALEVELKNPYSHELMVAFRKQTRTDIIIRPVTELGHSVAGHAFPAKTLSLRWESSAENLVFNSAQIQKLKIAPGQSVLLRAFSQIDFQCGLNIENTAGFFYDILPEGFRVYVSKTNSFAATADLTDVVALPILPKPVDVLRTNLLPGWHAFERETRPKLMSARGASSMDAEFYRNDLGVCGWLP